MLFYLKRIFFMFIFLLFQLVSIIESCEAYKKNTVSKNGYVVEASFAEDAKPCLRRKDLDKNAHVFFKDEIYIIDVPCRYFYKKGDKIGLIYSPYYDVLATPYHWYSLDLVAMIFMFFLSFSLFIFTLKSLKKMKLGKKTLASKSFSS